MNGRPTCPRTEPGHRQPGSLATDLPSTSQRQRRPQPEPFLSRPIQGLIRLNRLEKPLCHVLAHRRRQVHPRLVELRWAQRHATSLRLTGDSPPTSDLRHVRGLVIVPDGPAEGRDRHSACPQYRRCMIRSSGRTRGGNCCSTVEAPSKGTVKIHGRVQRREEHKQESLRSVRGARLLPWPRRGHWPWPLA